MILRENQFYPQVTENHKSKNFSAFLSNTEAVIDFSNWRKSLTQEKIITFVQPVFLIFTVIFTIKGIYYIKMGLDGGLAVSNFLLLAVSMSIYIFATIKLFSTYFKKQATELHTISEATASLKNESDARKAISKIFSKLHDDYVNIEYTGPTINKYKKDIVDLVATKLDDLRQHGHVTNLPPSESFGLSIPMINKLQEKDKVMAVTFLEQDKGEWENDFLWQSYINAQISAAKNNNVTVERIFITDKKKLDIDLQNTNFNVAKMHTEEQFEETKMTGFFLDYDSFMSYSDTVTGGIGHGFIVLDSTKSTGERMAVCDFFREIIDMQTEKKHYIYRTTVTFNGNEIDTKVGYYKLLRENQNLIRLSMKLHCTTYNNTENN